MENHRLVLPENMNQYGYMFGGYMLKWVDEYAWIAASKDYPGCRFFTVAMDKVEFKKSVNEGSILKFDVTKAKVGNTSVQYLVEVTYYDDKERKDILVFSNHVTLVRVDDNGKTTPIPK